MFAFEKSGTLTRNSDPKLDDFNDQDMVRDILGVHG